MSAASKTGVPMSEQIRFINKYRKSGTTDADWYQEQV